METSLDPSSLPPASPATTAPAPAPWSPVHTVYGGAQRFSPDVIARVGRHALTLLDTLAPAPADLRALPFGWSAEPADAALAALWTALRAKLTAAPVDDYRIDFEDGFGPRPDAEEDAAVVAAATALARASAASALPRGIGIRVKSLAPETARRALRTLDGFLTTLARAHAGAPVAGLVVTLPKVTARAEVAALVDALDRLERALGWTAHPIGVELMVETPRALLAADGTVALPGLVSAADGRCRAVHLGAWDLTAALGVPTAAQDLLHPYCDAARALMALSLAGTGVRVVDGATNAMPVEVHRGAALTAAQRAENRAAVTGALAVMTRHWQRATAMGVHQGWDLHPGQVMWRHALVIAHARADFAATAARLRAFVGQAAQAVRAGSVFDDAATGQGMLGDVLRAVDCGAVAEVEATAAVGVGVEALRTRSFGAIVGAAQPR